MTLNAVRQISHIFPLHHNIMATQWDNFVKITHLQNFDTEVIHSSDWFCRVVNLLDSLDLTLPCGSFYPFIDAFVY